MSRSLVAACAFALTAAAPLAHAQRFGTFGTSGLGSTSSFGNSAFGSSSFGGSTFGSGFGGGFGSSGFGSSGFGSSGFGSSFGSGFGSSGFGSSGFGNSGFGNSTFGNSGMGGQAFVGRDSADMASVWNQLGQAGTQYFNQMNRSMSRSNSSSRQQQTAKVDYVAQPMLVNLRLGFTPPKPSQAALTNTIRARLGRILAAQNIVAPQLTMEGDVAVLRGVAATESQKAVLEKLIAMEPGVSAVRNEMTVAAPIATE